MHSRHYLLPLPFPSLFHDTLQIEHTSTHDTDASAGAKARAQAGGSGERLGALIVDGHLAVDGGGVGEDNDGEVDMRTRTGAGGPTQPIQSKTFVSKPLNPNPDSRV